MAKHFTKPIAFVLGLLLPFFLFNAPGLNAQAFVINGPQEIAGGYEFEAAGFGATITDDVWTGDAIFVEDGTANPNQGCEAPLNADMVNGRIALIDRGSCEFGLKCLNAENAGAIAAVVVNSAPGAGAIVMGAGAVGGQVTIPCVMVPYEVGQLIRSAMLSDQVVNISLGNLEPPPPPANDISVTNFNVLVPQMGILPESQVRQAGDFVFTPGAEIVNRGVNAAPNYNIGITITHTPFGGDPTEVYNESFSSAESIDPGDTTDLILFPAFDPASPVNYGKGIYEYTYSISMDSTDNAEFNNATSGSFTISDNLFSKATWNPSTSEPNVTASTTIAGGGNIEFITALDIPYGEGFYISEVLFRAFRSEGLAGIPLSVYVYQWNDLDENLGIGAGELEVKGLAVYTFPEDETGIFEFLSLPVLDFETFEETGVLTQNDSKYLVGVRYEGAETVSLGFDANINYDRTVNWKQENGDTTDLDYGGIYNDAWTEEGIPDNLFTFGPTNVVTSTGIFLESLVNVKDIAGADEFEMSLFPNPVKNQLQVTVEFKEKAEFIEFYAYDSAGRLVLHKRSTDVFDTVQQTFDASSLPAGQYHLVIRTGLGIQAKPFVVQR
ncbi:MAG: T9SS type A sorting domain-containing protein [Phaeodactylibacter sp.]|nr:T9SS type A sorting domain-containing protein [Phaeodactylibacter sp.]